MTVTEAARFQDTSKPYLVVLDVDSTLIDDEVIELLAAKAGSLALVADVTERAMRGELDFAESLRERVATLAGLPDSVFAEVRTEVSLTSGARELVSTLKKHGSTVGVVSGGFHEIVDHLASELQLDQWRANRLEVVDGFLTGRVAGPIVTAQTKADSLKEWAEASGIPLDRTIAIGDGANDLVMMEAAALSVAFCAKPAVRDAADVAVSTRDLAQILPMLGL